MTLDAWAGSVPFEGLRGSYSFGVGEELRRCAHETVELGWLVPKWAAELVAVMLEQAPAMNAGQLGQALRYCKAAPTQAGVYERAHAVAALFVLSSVPTEALSQLLDAWRTARQLDAEDVPCALRDEG